MPRSRSRTKRPGRRPVVPDASVLVELLQTIDPDPEADPLLLDVFDRAAWSFHAGPDAWYTEPGSPSRQLARLRAREWFLLDFELPSGMTPAEEWVVESEGAPGSAGRRRAVERFVNSECGVFDVEDVQADGWLRLAPILGGDPVLARPIDRREEMVTGPVTAFPPFAKGDAIVGRLYRLDEGRAELSAGSDRILPEARRELLADPPDAKALRSALVAEALFGADAGRLLSMAGDLRFPRLVDDLLFALSDGTFGYQRLWQELEEEADPVAVARQLLAELDAWTGVEQELLACGVVGAWLRRREAAAGRAMTPATFERERRTVEEHLRTILDVPGEPELRLAPGAARLAMSREDAAEIMELPAEPVEWVVDVLRNDWTGGDAIRPAPSSYPLSCVIVEHETSGFDGLAAGDESEFQAGAGDEDGDREEEVAGADLAEGDVEEAPGEDDLGEDDLDEEGSDEEDPDLADDDEPQLILTAPVSHDEDQALVALQALVEGVLAGEERLPRPNRVVFRQRSIAARLAETLREVGFHVALRYLTEVVDVATHDVGPDADHKEPEDRDAQAVGTGKKGAPVFSDDERRQYERLLAAATRSREALDGLSSVLEEHDLAPISVTPSRPLAFSFTTLEGEETHAGAFTLVPRHGAEGLAIDLLFLPEAATGLDLRGPEGDLLLDAGDRVTIEIGDAGDMGEDYAADVKAAGWPCGKQGPCVIAVRTRPDAPPAFLRGPELALAAGVMEAVAALVDSADDHDWEDSLAADAHVDPLGDVKAEWRSAWGT